MREATSYAPGHVLAERTKGAVTWQARISTDRGRLEVVGIVPPSGTPTTIDVLTERELLELLGLDDDETELEAQRRTQSDPISHPDLGQDADPRTAPGPRSRPVRNQDGDDHG